MPLPEVTLPDELPPFLAAGHAIEQEDAYRDVPRARGRSRRRRIYSTAPRLVGGVLDLTQAQMEAFHDWYEGVLQAGAESFAVEVANQGPGVQWWEAHILEYTADPVFGGNWMLSLKLLLTGQPSATAPVLSSMRAEVAVPLVITAIGGASKLLQAEVGVDLAVAFINRLAAEILVNADLGMQSMGADIQLGLVMASAQLNPNLGAELLLDLAAASLALNPDLGSEVMLDLETEALSMGAQITCDLAATSAALHTGLRADVRVDLEMQVRSMGAQIDIDLSMTVA